MAAIAALGVLLIGYGLIRLFTGFEPGEALDKYITDIIIIIALGLFIYNRKMLKDEKRIAEKDEQKQENNQEEI